MSSSRNIGNVQPVVTLTCVVLCLAIALAFLGTQAISSMRDSANAIEDRRAVMAANAAISGLRHELSTAVQDKVLAYVADDPRRASSRHDDIKDNLASKGEDGPGYDVTILSTSAGEIISSGQQDAVPGVAERFGHLLTEQILAASHHETPVLNFYHDGDEVALIATQRIPASADGRQGEPDKVLSLVKLIKAGDISRIADRIEVRDLKLVERDPPKALQVPLTGPEGRAAAFLTWTTSSGADVFEGAYLHIFAAGITLVIFIAAVVVTGGTEVRRLQRLADQSRYEATHDSLTGVLNRFGFINELERLLYRKGSGLPLTVHLLDLDGFKPVNDAWGHPVGDRLLQEVARALRHAHSDLVTIARLGGDEFAMIQIGSENPIRVARKVRAILSEPFIIDGRTIEVGCSIGIAYESDVFNADELLRRADVALYQAKNEGRGRCVDFDFGLEAERRAATALENELKAALHNGEIQVAFQPVVCSTSGFVKGVEALARWSTAKGNVAPDIFIALAEKSGLIDALGMRVLRLAMQATRQFPELTLSVNVSPRQLCNPNFASDVIAAITEQEFSAKRLILEVTEGVLMSNPTQAKRAIDALRAEGITFALDDFGCGYASIGALREFGFDRMKIDRSLVTAASDDDSGLEVLKATIALAAALKIPVTAEGIETPYQAQLLRDAGCDQLQGFLLGKPMPRDALVEMLQSREAA